MTQKQTSIIDHPEFRVNFLIAGTAKGGTTALAKFLSKHPDVLIARQKEVNFFNGDKYFRKGCPDYAWYHKHFADTQGKFFGHNSLYLETAEDEDIPVQKAGMPKAVGEASPMYMWWREAAERIHRYNPAMKLIFILRNPIDRACSHHNMLVKKKREWLPFMAAMRFEAVRRFFSYRQMRGRAYIGRGLYGMQIRHMLQFFPKEQMLFLKAEELQERHQETLDRVFRFLGVAPMEVKAENVFSGGSYREPTTAERRWLWKKFEKDVAELEEITGWDCSGWRP